MCGVIGLLGPQEIAPGEDYWAAYDAYRGLLTLQHRGQDAAGILAYDTLKKKFYGEKDLGLVAQVFQQKNLETLRGNCAIGHTRYATIGSDGKNDLQPMVMGFPLGMGMVHNGNIVNYFSLANEMSKTYGLHLLTNNDLELMMHVFCQALGQDRSLVGKDIRLSDMNKAAKILLEKAIGAYALVGTVAGVGMFGLRDPFGIRPLVIGKKIKNGKTIWCLTSESNALNFLNMEFVRDVLPGELVVIDEEMNLHSTMIKEEKKKSHCMFEWIYFAGAESTIEGRSVYGARLGLGQVLAKKAKKLIDESMIHPDFVCPVPDTSRTASIALAEALGLPYREGLIKNRYTQRSFILNTQDKREKAVELKLSPVRSEIEGKNILLVDDSVVRGTTSKKIIDLLKRYGAKHVTLAVTCPPLRHGCFYGIDFPRSEDLIANGKSIPEIANWVGADQVIYIDEADLKEAIGVDGLCMACVDGKYPTSVSEAQEFARRRNEFKGKEA
ncbi:MAG: amidophosphoribosyltransferase [Bdellovibrio sp.]